MVYKVIKRELVDSISTPIMSLGKGVTLIHKVKLSRPDLKGNREYYHKEFLYRSKYTNPSKVSTVKLTHSSILTIENKNLDGVDTLIINTTNRDFIVKSLSGIKKILKRDDLFIEKDDGTFIVNPKLRKETTIAFPPYKGKVVIAKPCVITYDNDEYMEGVAINLDSIRGEYIEMVTGTFKTFLRIVKRFDFHVAGLTALTYLQSAEIGRHEIELNRSNIAEFDMDLSPELSLTEKKNTIEGLEVKTEPPKKNKGW